MLQLASRGSWYGWKKNLCCTFVGPWGGKYWKFVYKKTQQGLFIYSFLYLFQRMLQNLSCLIKAAVRCPYKLSLISQTVQTGPSKCDSNVNDEGGNSQNLQKSIQTQLIRFCLSVWVKRINCLGKDSYFFSYKQENFDKYPCICLT